MVSLKTFIYAFLQSIYKNGNKISKRKFWLVGSQLLSLPSPKNCRVGQGVKTPPFHGGITGSIPVRGTKPANLQVFLFPKMPANTMFGVSSFPFVSLNYIFFCYFLLLRCYSIVTLGYICANIIQLKETKRMASVKLRRRKNNDGTISLYLDYYASYKDVNGNTKIRRKYEFLDECKQQKAFTPMDRQENKNRLQTAEQIRSKKEIEILSRQHDIEQPGKREIYFADYCDDFLKGYKKANVRNVSGAINHFKTYIRTTKHKDLFCRELTPELCQNYYDYLAEHLNGETIPTYFKLFKKIVKAAVKDGFIKSNVTDDVVYQKIEPGKKEILTFDELAELVKVPCPNNEVRKAFLFSCYTGLRWVDVKNLKWQNVANNRLKLIQAKTGHLVDNNLHPVAIQLLGEPCKADGLVFNLPSHTGAAKSLRVWCARAEINKHITWHSARHGYGTNIILHGETDVNTASKLLGHKSLCYTERYVHEVESLKEAATNKLPTIEI